VSAGRRGWAAAAALWLAAAFPVLAATVAAGDPAPAILVKGSAHQALFAIAIDGSAGLATGAAGEMLRTTDAGRSWQPAPAAPTTLSLLGVAMAAGHIIAVGQQGTVLIGKPGEALHAVKSGTPERLFAVRLTGAGKAIAVGAFGTILISDNFGAHWRAAAPDWTPFTSDGQQPHLYAAQIGADGTLTVAGEFGLILQSTDGKSWHGVHNGAQSVFALTMRPDQTGFAVGQSGLVLATNDGGRTWQDRKSGTDAILLGVAAASGGHAVITGMHDALVSADDGITWSHLPGTLLTESWFQDVVAGPRPREWLAVGHAGTVIDMTVY
jgi:photosystem II stability/assembly factor-like uncharacterized protein